MAASTAKTNLLGLERPALEAFFAGLGEKPFHARQLMQWMYQRGVSDLAAMTDLGKGLRGKLADCAEVRLAPVLRDQQSSDGTRKWLLGMDLWNAIETVLIPEEGRNTLCISSQVGCALNCSFCATGKQGFNRNLTSAEIIGQVLVAQGALGSDYPITNVVFMGMGEPLANYKNLLPVLRILLDDYAYGLSKRRVTVSTSGLVPTLDQLSRDCDVALAISLHAPNDALRSQLMPINKVHPIAELMAACRRYLANKDRSHVHVTFEYVMLDGVNDSLDQAHELAALIRDIPCKVNLIPFNPFRGTQYRRSPQSVIDRFAECLWQEGIITVTRRTRGEDIDAACGQLAGRVQDRIQRAAREHAAPRVSP
ncbi:MAG: 23S rRNA (adenine(2503)-C(2))-methyltransferase RlmN [Gammaproteobacteria bacterium]